MSLLTGLDKLVSQIAGPLLFEQARLLRGGSYSVNPATGQTVFTPSTEYVKAIEGDYSAFHRQSLDIPDINRKLSILGYQVATPRPGDRVSIRGVIWEIVRVERDPANALYECEVKPIGADIAGDPGATVNALTPLPGLLASIAGPLLFGPATLFRMQTRAIDSNGQALRSDLPEAISGLEVEYTATHRAQAGIPETDRSLLVLGAGLSGPPVPGDRIDINGLRFEIVRTQRDPARAVYECQSRPIGIAVAIRYATHAGILPAYEGAATAQLTFFYHAGILPAFQSSANAAASIAATSGASLPAFAGQATAEAGALAYLGGVLAPYTGNAVARADIAAAHASNLSPLAGAGSASVRVSGSHAGSLAPIAGTAEASVAAGGRTATHAGTLPAYQSEALAMGDAAASHAGTLAAMAGTATGTAAVAASSLQSLPAYQGSGQAANAASAQSEGILPIYAGLATGTAATAASHGGTLPAYQGTATATNPPSSMFDAWTIHAWDPDAGADASGIIADAVGSAPLYAAIGTSVIPNWAGEITDGQRTALVALPADMSAFRSDSSCTITFWIMFRSTSGTFSNLASNAAGPPLSTGIASSWLIRRHDTDGYQFQVRNSGYTDVSLMSGVPAADTWVMITLRLEANQYRAFLNARASQADVTSNGHAKADINNILKFGGSAVAADTISDGIGDAGGLRGRFGDIRVHNKILSDAEIDALYAAGRQSY